MMEEDALKSALSRAKSYPYPRPTSSFVFFDDKTYTFDEKFWQGPQQVADLLVKEADTPDASLQRLQQILHGSHAERELSQPLTPVLAIGSNSSPEQLARKFPQAAFAGTVLIPVVRAVLEDFDVVYAPLLASYGSCPATLDTSPGTAVQLSVTFLSPRLLQHMHSTEGSYNLLRLQHIRLHLGLDLTGFRNGAEACMLLDNILQYNHQLGSFLPCNVAGLVDSVAIQEIPALRRIYPAKTQEEMLEFLHAYLEREDQHSRSRLGDDQERLGNPEQDDVWPGKGSLVAHNQWIFENVQNDSLRLARNKSLAKSTKSFTYAPSEILANLGELHRGAP